MKVLKVILKVLLILFFMFSVILFATQIWLLSRWAELTAAEVLYHILSPLNGANPDMVKDYIIKFFVPAFLFIAVMVVVFIVAVKKKKTRIFFIAITLMGLLLMGISIARIEKNIGLFSYAFNYLKAKKFEGEDFIEINYTDPKKTELTFPEKKRNLIFIFLESMEVTFTDKESGGGFDVNCIPELTELAKENECFSGSDTKLAGGVSLPGTNWTMGAMFGMTSGLPLQISLGANSMGREDSFFSGATTLGDILQREGYKQVLLLGSEAHFGGRESYFTEHGNYEMLDYNWAIREGKIPADYKVWWGYEDEKLFEYAKEECTKLASGDEPFNMTMLTVDTHFPDGYVCGLCGNEYEDQYANVFACSSKQAVEFVKWIQEQDFYEDTTIVISGDHPTMDPDFTDNVAKKYSRRTYTCIINSAAEKKSNKKRDFATLDIFPTTLAAMGVEIEGNRLGMGVNLYSDEKSIIEQYGEKVCSDRINIPSTFMEKLSNVVITTEDLDRIKKAKIAVSADKSGNGLQVTQLHIRSIKAASLQKCDLEVYNKKTKETKHYEMNRVTYPDNPAKFSNQIVIDGTMDDIKDLQMTIYFTVEGIEHYRINTWNYSEEEQAWIPE